MNAVSSPLLSRWLPLALCCLLLSAVPLFAADSVHTATTLQANFMMDFVADRSRMIQVSVVAVVVGCSLLWWRR